MSFDSIAYLEDWLKDGRYPEIHTPITEMAKAYLRGPRVLDLCCCFGLLGRRIREECPHLEYVMGVDANPRTVSAGAFNSVLPMEVLKITRDTAEAFYDQIIAAQQITSIVARRAFPELFGEDLEFGQEWVRTIHKLGVGEVLLEGRMLSSRSTNNLASVAREIQLLSPCYHEIASKGNVVYLRASH